MGSPGDTSGATGGTGSAQDEKPAAMATLIHHCTLALAIADDRGEKFLSYLLGMTLKAARQRLGPAQGRADDEGA